MYPNDYASSLVDPKYFTLDYYTNAVNGFFDWLKTFHIAGSIYFFSYVLSLFGITMIIYCLVRLVEIYFEEHGHLKHAIAEYAAREAEVSNGSKNERWDHIQDLVNSPNPSDWRLSIIEADSILEGLLDARGLHGAGIGEKLKAMSPGDLSSMQAAWEAHLVRNRIAHEGSDYDLNQRDARRTVSLYEMVFRELGFL